MSVNLATKARLQVGKLIVGNPNSDGSALPVGVALAAQGVTFIQQATINPGAIVAQTVFSLAVTVTGAGVGDQVDLIPPAGIIAGVTWSAYVSAANTVTVRIANGTAGSITPASASWGILLRKYT